MSKYVRANLKYLRLVRGTLSQREVSLATGIGQKTLSALETGSTKGIEFNTLAKLCDFFHCTPSDILTVEDEPDAIAPSQKSLEKADQLITHGLQSAMSAPKQTAAELWAEFEALRERIQSSQSDTTNSKRLRA
jgi:DNA-binding Xre family transcriptional regulator